MGVSYHLQQYLTEILATHLNESWTHHFQLGLAKVLKCSILIMVGLAKIFRNVLWTCQIKLLQVSQPDLSYMMLVSFIVGRNSRQPLTCLKSLTILLSSFNEYILPCAGIKQNFSGDWH